MNKHILKLVAVSLMVIGAQSFASRPSSASAVQKPQPVLPVFYHPTILVNKFSTFENKEKLIDYCRLFSAGHIVALRSDRNVEGSIIEWCVEDDTRNKTYVYPVGDIDVRKVFLCKSKPLKTLWRVPVKYETNTIIGTETRDASKKLLSSKVDEVRGERWSYYAKAVPVISALAMIGGAYAWIKGSNKK